MPLALAAPETIRPKDPFFQAISGLKLNKIGRQSDLPDNPMTRGMINKVKHLVRVVDGK